VRGKRRRYIKLSGKLWADIKPLGDQTLLTTSGQIKALGKRRRYIKPLGKCREYLKCLATAGHIKMLGSAQHMASWHGSARGYRVAGKVPVAYQAAGKMQGTSHVAWKAPHVLGSRRPDMKVLGKPEHQSSCGQNAGPMSSYSESISP
jgi:hypothetical protein